MKIFVTGGTGFIGKHAVAELQKGKHQLLLLSRQDPKAVFKSTRGMKILRGDLGNIEKWKGGLKRFKPDVALHLAWEGIPDYSPEMSMKNLQASIALLRTLGEIGCPKVVITGSSWELGGWTGEVSEDSGFKPANGFAAAKVALYAMGKEIAKQYNLQLVWARIFYAYGPGQKSASLIPHLIERKRQGLDPDVKNPNGANDFIYVGDIARALKMLAEKPAASYQPPAESYNLGFGRLTGVKEIVKAVYGKDLIKRKGKVQGFWADISKMQKEFGWKPKVKIEEGVKRMMNG